MKKYNKKEIMIVSLVIILFVFGFVLLTGTFNSSYHLQDDHEFIRISNDLKEKNILSVIFDWTSNGLNIRFRPLYHIIRVLLVSIFGLHFKLWYTWKALEIFGISFFLYFFARNLKCNKFVSCIFTLLVLIGNQIAIWYRLGPQESTGLLFLSIALFFISEYYLYNENKRNIIIAAIFMFLMSLMKESFVLMLPPILFLGLGLYSYKNGDKNIKNILIDNKKIIMTIMTLFFIEIFVIVFLIGTNKIGYAGFSSDTTTYQYLEGIRKSLISDGLINQAILFLIAGGITLASYNNIKNKKSFLGIILFVVITIIFQLILHAKSTMFERYIVPMSVAYSFIIVILGSKFLKNKGTLIIYFGLILLVIAGLFNQSITRASEFANNGKNINDYLWYIRNNIDKNKNIFIAMNGELEYSTDIYLRNYGYNNLYEYQSDFKYSTLPTKQVKSIDDIIKNIDVVVLTEQYYSFIFTEKYLSLNDFNHLEFGPYEIFIKL